MEGKVNDKLEQYGKVKGKQPSWVYESICLGGGHKENFGSPLGNIEPPSLKNPFFEKIMIPFLNFFLPSPLDVF